MEIQFEKENIYLGADRSKLFEPERLNTVGLNTNGGVSTDHTSSNRIELSQ